MWRPQKSELGAKAKRTQTSATKRLLQDLKYIQDNTVPTVGVVALPLEKDLFTWHCNVRGPKGTPYEGGVFHLVLDFPKTYPTDPPTVTVCTTLQHPNVFGNSICLDMLQPGEEQERYMGWSSAYSAQSILIQLQAFLFEESPTIRAEDCRKAVEAANNYSCRSCKHRPLRSWPPFPTYEKEAFVLEKDEKEIIKEELVCYHSKKSFREDCLGFGISFTKNIRTGDIQDISTPLDLLGVRAFIREGIRKSSINEPFTHWIPVFVDEEHGKKGYHLAKKSLSMICNGNTKEFKPEMALKVFPKLMNTMVVQIMKGQIHASIKALEGYCAFHQMFLKFLEEYPELLKECQEKVNSFLQDEKARHKDKLPNLGEFMPLLTVTPEVSWKEVAPAIVQESFDRAVFHLIKDYRELAKEEEDPVVDKERVNVTFGASIVGHRLIMFHMYFLEHVARPLGKAIPEMSKSYADLYGRPSVRMVEDMLQAFRDIKKVKNHSDFFGRIGLPILSEEELKVLLRKSVTNSRVKGYHGVEGVKVPTAEELAAEAAKLIAPLNTLLDTTEETKTPKLHSREDDWKELCKTRWGVTTLPKEAERHPHPWKHLYLQNNLQDFVNALNDRPDFPAFYETLDLSAPTIRELEITIFNPKKLKSGFHFLTALLTKLVNLETLRITKGPDGGLGIKGTRALVKGLKNNGGSLKVLDLHYSGIDGSCTELLGEGLLACSGLLTLNLEGNTIGYGIKGLTPLLWGHKSLTELNLVSCSIDQDAAKELADGLLANKKLKVVKLAKNHLGDAGLRAIIYNLAFSPSLEVLDISRIENTSGDSSVSEALSKLFRISVTLNTLNMWRTNIASSLTSDTIDALANNRSITKLDLGHVGSINNNQLGYLGKALAANKTLATLILENNSISGYGFETFYNALFLEKEEKEKGKEKESQTRERRRLEMLDKVKEVEKTFSLNLVELNLTNNSLTAGGKVLGKVVHIAASLSSLDLENCQLDATAGETLGLSLEENKSLKRLNLKQNNLGKEGAKALAAGLEHNATLEYLDLSGNGIGVSGARALAHMLANNKSITFLNLFGNLIDVDGAREMATALGTNSTLVELDLGLNRIRDKGAKAVSKALATNASLRKLGVKLNFIKDSGAVNLAKAVAASQIIKFSLAGNEFEDDSLVQIFDLLKSSGKEEGFDLGSRIALIDPDRVTRSIWITPLPAQVKKENVKKVFYDNHCGVVLNVSIHDHKRKAGSNKAKYAFVEFAHSNSVALALDLSSCGKARVNHQKVYIYRVGTGSKQLEVAGQGRAAKQPPAFGGRGGRQPAAPRGRDRRPAGRGRGAPARRGRR